MGVFGGGILVLVAVLLWAAVLVPKILHNRQIKAQEKQAQKLERTMQALAAVARETGEDKLVKSAREALNREKMQQLQLRQEEARHTAELARAKAEKELAVLEAKRAEQQEKARVRAEKLAGPEMQRVRVTLAVFAVFAMLAFIVGLGFIIAGQSAVILLTGFAVLTVTGAGLVLLAPGRNAEVTAQRLAQQIKLKESRVAAAKTHEDLTVKERAAAVLQAAAELAAETEREKQRELQDSALRHAAAQQAAEERIQRAQAQARARGKRVETAAKGNQTGSILLKHHAEPATYATSATLPRVAAFRAAAFDVAVQAAVCELSSQQVINVSQSAKTQALSGGAIEAQKSGVQPATTQTTAVKDLQEQTATEQLTALQQSETQPLTPQQRERQELVKRLRSMGDLSNLSEGAVDLDAALRKRRSAN